MGDGRLDDYLYGKRYVLRLDLKDESDLAWRREGGRSFQDEGPATENARDSMDFRRSGRGTVRREGSNSWRSND